MCSGVHSQACTSSEDPLPGPPGQWFAVLHSIMPREDLPSSHRPLLCCGTLTLKNPDIYSAVTVLGILWAQLFHGDKALSKGVSKNHIFPGRAQKVSGLGHVYTAKLCRPMLYRHTAAAVIVCMYAMRLLSAVGIFTGNTSIYAELQQHRNQQTDP
ncbi:hypothetical protein UY3_07147 [Chelonia mydas]|uniref:Uncharacterized protein n=1 Tax=Chelonia mydas TaxID=8469 RepID=M7BCH4_CHEMY|nr:hypothetical protein UY3_07147 [Chelonia mydas]